MTTFIAKLLASTLTQKLAKVILITLLTELAKRSDNKIDDEIVAAVKEALQ